MRPLKAMISSVTRLSKQCAAITFDRTRKTRSTPAKHRLAQINLPLISVLNRLKWRLVIQDHAEFEKHVRLALVEFHREIQLMVQAMPSGMRSNPLLMLLDSSAKAIQF